DRQEEIAKISYKIYELIEKTIGVYTLEKVGEVELVNELANLEINKRPINAIRVLGHIKRAASGHRSDFYASLTNEVELIVDEVRQQNEVTKDVIGKIKLVRERLERR